MTVALASPQANYLSWGFSPRPGIGTRLTELQQPSRAIRLATVGVVVVFGAWLPLLTLGGVATAGPDLVDPGAIKYAAMATIWYLPLQVWLVWSVTRDARPQGQGWALAVIAVVIIGTLPVVGVRWGVALAYVAALVLIVIPLPWSLLLSAGVAVTSALLAFWFGHPELALNYLLTALLVTSSLAVLVWLVRAARQLEAARLALAEEAVVGERLRIEGELRRTVGGALELIAASAERLGGLAADQPLAAAGELGVLVDRSRRTLADARRLLSRYQEVSLQAELETAATLLAAQGIKLRLDLEPDELAQAGDAAERAALRRDLTRLLGDGAASRSVVTVTRHNGRVRLAVHAGEPEPAFTEVAG